MQILQLNTELDFLKQQKKIINYFDENRRSEALDLKIQMQELIESIDTTKQYFNVKLYNWFDKHYTT